MYMMFHTSFNNVYSITLNVLSDDLSISSTVYDEQH